MLFYLVPKNTYNIAIPKAGISYSLWPALLLWYSLSFRQLALKSSFSMFLGNLGGLEEKKGPALEEGGRKKKGI